ncbi:MAG: hypothetical protein AMXMBFR36_26200 [Acidobacteriota bacterium]
MVAVTWLLLLVVQPLLVQQRRLELHRRLGRVTWIVALLFALASTLLAHRRTAQMDLATLDAEAAFFYLPFHTTALFVVCYALGLAFRATPAAHGRFMVATALLMIDPVVGRILHFYFPPLPDPRWIAVLTFALTDLLLAALVFTFRGPVPARRALLAMFALFVVAHTLWFTFAPTRPWHDLVVRFRSLPLT